MKNTSTDKAKFIEYISTANEDEYEVFLYLHQLGLTFVHVNRMEDAIISAMSMCDRVKVKLVLKEDAEKWEQMLAKQTLLQDSTLGNLINILSNHTISEIDINYLRWVKRKRDLFIHRFFHDGRWPGNLSAIHCKHLIRQLKYLDIIFDRASHKIWRILSDNKLLMRVELGEAGALMMNFGHPFSDQDGEGE